MHNPNNKKPAGKSGDLELQYRKIGISALAAALPYQSDARNPAYTPAVSRPADEKQDIAA